MGLFLSCIPAATGIIHLMTRLFRFLSYLSKTSKRNTEMNQTSILFRLSFVLFTFLCMAFACEVYAGEYHINNSCIVSNTDCSLTKLIVILPLPQTNQYQIVKNVDTHGGEILAIPNTDDEYIRWTYGGGVPPSGASITIGYDFDVILKSFVFDFNTITTIYPYDTSSITYHRYTDSSGAYVNPYKDTIQIIGTMLWNQSSNIIDYAERCYDYVALHYKYLDPGTGLHPLDTILVHGGGDCGNLCSIFISLLRFKGIPSRHVQTFRPDGSWDVWAEFYLENYGWIPVGVAQKQSNPGGDYFGKYDGSTVVLQRAAWFLIEREKDSSFYTPGLQGYYWWWWYNSGGGHMKCSQVITSSVIISAAISPASIFFPNIPYGSNRIDSITVKNLRTDSLVIDSVRSSGADFTIFPLNGSIAPLDSEKFYVTFTPTTYRSVSAGIRFYYNGTTSVSYVYGTGLTAWYSATPSTIDFGENHLLSSKQTSVTITNPGNLQLDIDSIVNSYPEEFRIEPVAPFHIPPAGNVTLHLTYSIFTEGTKIARFICFHNAPGSPDTIIATGTGLSTALVTFPLNRSWNLVSVPVIVDDWAKQSIFPGTTGSAYRFDGGYQPTDTLVTGVGYWIKIPSGRMDTLIGTPLRSDSLELHSGWNLVGSIYLPIAATDVLTDTPGLILSQFFEYQRGYVSADTIKPGRGYWVKASMDGQIILDMAHMASMQARIIPTLDMPPAPPVEAGLLTQLPKEYNLGQAYPNPFNPAATIRYALPEASNVQLTIYNTLGQVIATLLDEVKDGGYQSVSWNAGSNASGLYFYHLDATSLSDPAKHFSQTKKMVLIK
jgi:hypothetical protein